MDNLVGYHENDAKNTKYVYDYFNCQIPAKIIEIVDNRITIANGLSSCDLFVSYEDDRIRICLSEADAKYKKYIMDDYDEDNGCLLESEELPVNIYSKSLEVVVSPIICTNGETKEYIYLFHGNTVVITYTYTTSAISISLKDVLAIDNYLKPINFETLEF